MGKGKFVITAYEAEDGNDYLCRVREDTRDVPFPGGGNRADVKAETVKIRVNCSHHRRKNGINVRMVEAKNTVPGGGQIDQGSTTVRLPVLRRQAGSRLKVGSRFQYNGRGRVVTAILEETVV